MGKKTKKVELYGDDMQLTKGDSETVSEIIYDALLEMGIFCDSFSWSINVEYVPQENDDEI